MEIHFQYIDHFVALHMAVLIDYFEFPGSDCLVALVAYYLTPPHASKRRKAETWVWVQWDRKEDY